MEKQKGEESYGAALLDYSNTIDWLMCHVLNDDRRRLLGTMLGRWGGGVEGGEQQQQQQVHHDHHNNHHSSCVNACDKVLC